MKYHELKLQPMQESGAFLLRAMQNEEMPRLDLLVRESVQNSLDAALERGKGGEVRIDFHLRKHSCETIASLLREGIDRKALLARHPAGGRLLEIRDSLTEGLTGPLGFEKIGADGVHGNLLKLVFEIGRTRSDSGAGGSWGLGKTCYFQMGVGLVFYYSRIRLGDVYQERLVASLVEDETRPDKLQSDTKTGIGWWGSSAGLEPITQSAPIRRTLELLRVRPFTGTETGTSIVIPFLRDDLVPAVEMDDHGASMRRPTWYDSYDDYIRIALERWFCARLDNRHFATGPRLTASVNGELISRNGMLPVFQVAQALYNSAIGAPYEDGGYLMRAGVAEDAMMHQRIAPNSLFTPPGPAGEVAAAFLTPEQMGMVAGLNHEDPGMCVFGRPDETPPFRPLVTFMRRPGMCVRWDDSTESRGWAGGLPGLANGRYLVAVFVPRQDRTLKNAGRREQGKVTLESYLRGCERSDHADWHDVAGMKIIEKIRATCGRHLREFGSRRPATSAAPPIRIARNLADLLLPVHGMGGDGRNGQPSPRPSPPGGGKGKRNRSSSDAPELRVVEVTYTAKGMQIRWSLKWGSASPGVPRKIFLSVESEGGPITLQQWSNDKLGSFPFMLLDASLEAKPMDTADATVEIGGGAAGEILLHSLTDMMPDELAGVVRIEQIADGAGELRPVLAAGVVGSGSESA